MKYLSFISKMSPLFLLIIMACSTKPTITVSNTELKRQWMMVEFRDYKKEELMKKKASLDLTNSQYSANMGCNSIGFDVDIKDTSNVVFSKIRSTKKLCLDNNQLEEHFIKALSEVNHYTINGHFLTLTNSKGEIMRFVAADWD